MKMFNIRLPSLFSKSNHSHIAYGSRLREKTFYGQVLFFSFFLISQNCYSFQTLIPALGKGIINIITIDTLSPNIIYVGMGSDFSSGETGFMFKSTNAGATWDTLLRNVTVRDIDIHPIDRNILYVSLGINFLTPAGVVKSLDGGKTWAKADSGVYSDSEVGPSQLSIDPLHPETLYVGTAGVFGGKFYKTTNGGNYWFSLGDTTNLKYGPTAIAVNPDSTQVIYAGTNHAGYIMKSTNGGLAWKFTGLENGFTISIKFGYPTSILYFGSSNAEYPRGIFKSDDAGGTWKNIDEGIIDSIFDVHSIEFDGSGTSRRIFITGNTHEYKPRIYYRSENESKWKVLSIDSTVPQFNTMTIHNGKIWIGSWGGLYVMDVPTDVLQKSEPTNPHNIWLYPSFPNPFNGSTRILFETVKAAEISLDVFDLLGRKVKTLFVGKQNLGLHSADWDGTDYSGRIVSSGVYFTVLRSNDAVSIRRMVYLK